MRRERARAKESVVGGTNTAHILSPGSMGPEDSKGRPAEMWAPKNYGLIKGNQCRVKERSKRNLGLGGQNTFFSKVSSEYPKGLVEGTWAPNGPGEDRG